MATSNFMTVDDVNKKLDQGLEEIFKQDRFKELLNLMSKVNHYSMNNMLLIMSQKPDATMVQGYKAWQ